MQSTGHRTRLWCCQDAARRKKAKKKEGDGIIHRDTVGMCRYDCNSSLIVSCRIADSDSTNHIILYCVVNDLREVWAYLWGNWYRPGRWELWARSSHEKIVVLKTTMILEAQYVSHSSHNKSGGRTNHLPAGVASNMTFCIIFTNHGWTSWCG